MARTALGLGLAFLAGAVMAWSLRGAGDRAGPSLVETRPAPRHTAPASGGPALADVRAELADLRAALARIEERLAAAAPATAPAEPRAARAPAAEPVDPGTLQRILDEVDALRAAVEADAAAERTARLQRLRAEKPDADWTALQPLVERFRVDEEGARKEVLLLAETGVLERFGSPDLMWTNERGTHWVYGRDWDPVAERYALQLVLRVTDGTVTALWVE